MSSHLDIWLLAKIIFHLHEFFSPAVDLFIPGEWTWQKGGDPIQFANPGNPFVLSMMSVEWQLVQSENSSVRSFNFYSADGCRSLRAKKVELKINSCISVQFLQKFRWRAGRKAPALISASAGKNSFHVSVPSSATQPNTINPTLHFSLPATWYHWLPL